jgi:DNA-binding NarL/FixJ family response regulator
LSDRVLRVLIADDHEIVRHGLAALLSEAGDVELVGEAGNGREAVDLAYQLRPDVVIMDVAMPLLNGLDACQQLRPRLPSTKWVFVTVNEDPDLAAEAFRLGAAGYLLKHSAAAELFEAIETVLGGGRHLTPLIAQGAPLGSFLATARAAPTDALTARQREVLQLLAEGRVMKEVAQILGMSPRTVAFHKYEVMRRLHVKSTAELVQHAIRLGLIRP